jgi:hypothetical protein
MFAYAWPKQELFSSQNPPANKPVSVKRAFIVLSGTFRRGNPCFPCKAARSDYLVHSEPDSAFFVLGGGVEKSIREGF